MAQKQAPAANILDVKWVLSEVTGRLSYDGFRHVSRNPRHQLMIEHVSDTVTREFADRFRRILNDKRARGV